MVWKSTTAIGCAMVECPGGSVLGGVSWDWDCGCLSRARYTDSDTKRCRMNRVELVTTSSASTTRVGFFPFFPESLFVPLNAQAEKADWDSIVDCYQPATLAENTPRMSALPARKMLAARRETQRGGRKKLRGWFSLHKATSKRHCRRGWSWFLALAALYICRRRP
jgi:hypothetical protein